MIGKIRNFDKKKYEILSTSRIKIHDDEEKMQIKNIIEQSVKELPDMEYNIFIDIIDTRVAVNELKSLQKLALSLYFLTEEIEMHTDKYGEALKVSNKEHILKKWEDNREKLFPEKVVSESELLANMKNEITLKIEEDSRLLEFVTQPLIYDVFFGGYYLRENAVVKKLKENFILDFNMPIILEYKQAKSNQNSNFIEINVSLDEYNVPEIKVMEVFETLGIDYQRENLFLEGNGIIELNLKTGRISQANLRIVGGIKGTFNNIQEIKLKGI